MPYNNPPISWSELERKLSDRHRPGGPPMEADGGDSPAWSRVRQPYVADPKRRITKPDGPVVPYAELHCHSYFSFLDGASSPEELIEEAIQLGLEALALTDHDGFYGVARMAEVAEVHHNQGNDLLTVFGAELSMDLTKPQNGIADPEGSHLLVLARGQEGYHRLAAAITKAQLKGAEKGKPSYDLEELAADSKDEWFVLTGCRKGLVRQALATGGREAAAAELDRLVALFDRDHLAVELYDHGYPLDTTHNDVLAGLARDAGLPVVATNNVHYAAPRRRRLASALAAVRARRGLDEMDGWLPACGTAYLRSGAEMAALFRRYDGAVAHTTKLAGQLGFMLRQAKPKLPRQDVPAGHTPMSWLYALCLDGVRKRYADTENEGRARKRVKRELAVIEKLNFPGYFLIVHEIVSFARRKGILCQGRGSAANSVVCYVLGITAVDPVKFDLPFERFLSATREEEPDIDVDFDSNRREEVIQWVYQRYGRHNAAQVANVITYRPKLAVRDMAKALGHSTGQQDAWSKQVDAWGAGVSSQDHDIPAPVVELAEDLLKFPRHLGIHSGGMVLTERPVGEVVPIEHARMENRTVIQWDKDDCAWMGLVKFDLLGLGMLAALQYSMDTIREKLGEDWDLDKIPKDEPGVYDQLCRADSVGVFQVESRAQMATLPRLRPRGFYDLAIEVALIRPGPIQGGAVHPFIRRKLLQEPVTYLHPKLEPVLKRTLGVPLFQEQLMQIAMEVGDCSGDDADLLRRAMGSKRGVEKISSLKKKLFDGMENHGITGELAEEIYAKIEAFANFGFAESHSISFALLVYSSTWLRLHYPAAFLAALLRAQPMGFYSPQSLVADARRHGVEVRRPDLLLSGVHPVLEPVVFGPIQATGGPACLERHQPPVGEFDEKAEFDSDLHRRDAMYAVRLGLAAVKSIGEQLATEIVTERDEKGMYADMADLVRRIGLTGVQVEALATAGAFECLGLSRREALWQAGRAAQERPDHLPGVTSSGPAPMLPGMSEVETTMADLWATGVSPRDHPIRHLRPDLDAAGILSAERVRTAPAETWVRVAGVVTHRQRPATASGITFMSLEDETGMVNVICRKNVWDRHRRVARESSALIILGKLERAEGVTNVVAGQMWRLPLAARTVSRDFH